jgi:hypothetical protein
MNLHVDLVFTMMASTYYQPSSRRTYMLQWSITPKTAKRYQQHVKEFINYCTLQQQEDITDEQEFDDLLLDYIHHLYESGLGKTKGSMTLYGIFNVLPNLKGKLPKSSQAILGWNKHTPGRSYPPLTWELAVVIAVQMSRSGHYEYGVGLLLAFDCFLRVSELTNINIDNIADEGDHRIGVEHKGILLSLTSTKTGKNQWVEILNPSVIILIRGLIKQTKPHSNLFTFKAQTFRQLLHATCADLGLSPFYVPHSLRHGGATRYRHVLKWSIEDVMARGRWASSTSARRYIQSGVAMLLNTSAPKSITTAGITMTKDIVKYMSLAQKH